jgi:predicted nuclease with TOPRIM domain
VKKLIENKPVVFSLGALLTMAFAIAGFGYRMGQYEADLRNDVETYAERIEIIERNQENIINRLNEKDVTYATIEQDIKYIIEALDRLEEKVE